MDQNENNSSGIKSIIEDILGLSAETAKIVIISLIVIIGIRTYVMQPFFVSGSSMEPNFHDGDYLIVDELSYEIGQPQRGDVIIFKYPKNPKDYFIKRIIALPGEKIEIANNTIKIYNAEHPDGFTLDEDIYLPPENVTMGNYTAELKNDEYYVLGDNRPASADSRFWGILEKHYIVGKALVRAWPYTKISVFEGVQYGD